MWIAAFADGFLEVFLNYKKYQYAPFQTHLGDMIKLELNRKKVQILEIKKFVMFELATSTRTSPTDTKKTCRQVRGI